MRVTVVCFGSLRDYLPPGASGNSVEVEVPDGATPKDLLDAIGAPERLLFAALVDGDHARLDQRLQEGTEVTLMPPFTGGTENEVLER